MSEIAESDVNEWVKNKRVGADKKSNVWYDLFVSSRKDYIG